MAFLKQQLGNPQKCACARGQTHCQAQQEDMFQLFWKEAKKIRSPSPNTRTDFPSARTTSN